MLTQFIITWIVTSISLIVLTELPLGVKIDKFSTAFVGALVLGLLNAFLRPVLGFLAFPITFLTFGLFAVVLNAIVFALATALVDGFELRGGCLSAILAPIVIGLFNSIIFAILG